MEVIDYEPLTFPYVSRRVYFVSMLTQTLLSQALRGLNEKSLTKYIGDRKWIHYYRFVHSINDLADRVQYRRGHPSLTRPPQGRQMSPLMRTISKGLKSS